MTHPSPRRRALSAAAALAVIPVALGAGGCGKSDQDQAKEAVNTFLQQSVHPSAKICDLVAKDVISRRFGPGDAGMKKCRMTADQNGKMGNRGNLPKDLKITNVKIMGKMGTVTATAPGQGSGTFTVVKEGDKWKIKSAGNA